MVTRHHFAPDERNNQARHAAAHVLSIRLRHRQIQGLRARKLDLILNHNRIHRVRPTRIVRSKNGNAYVRTTTVHNFNYLHIRHQDQDEDHLLNRFQNNDVNVNAYNIVELNHVNLNQVVLIANVHANILAINIYQDFNLNNKLLNVNHELIVNRNNHTRTNSTTGRHCNNRSNR